MRPRIVLCAALLAGVSILPIAPAQARVLPDTARGMHVAGIQGGRWPAYPTHAVRLWDAGTTWSQVETSPGQYDWTALDAAVRTAEANGARDILLVLGSTPRWNATRVSSGDYPTPGAASMPRSMATWDRWVTAVVERYRGRVTSYQVWNEASLPMFWNGTPTQMAELTARTFRIVQQLDPAAVVVAASTTVRLQAAFARFFPAYLRALRARQWPVEAFAAHTYPASTGTPATRAAHVRQVKAALAAAGAPRRPLWDTELNYGLAGPGPTRPVERITGARAAAWTVRTMLDSTRLGVARTYWYAWTRAPYALLGMQFVDGSAAARGLRVHRAWTRGDWRGCVERDRVVRCHVVDAGQRATILFTVTGTATVALPAGSRLVCPVSGPCRTAGSRVRLTSWPVRVLP